MTALGERYRRFFAISEIENSKILQALYWALLFGFFLSFDRWVAQDVITISAAQHGQHQCLPYFLNCDKLYFFNTYPISYGQSAFYACLAGLLTLSSLAAVRGKWHVAHALMVPAFAWKVFYVAVLTYNAAVDFEYFHLPVTFIFLFSHRKLYFARRIWVVVYLLAATMKFTESWVVGNYFTSLRLGMPFVPNELVPFATNGVALFEIVTPWLLLSRNRRIRISVLAMWILFHLYSIILVHFRYPAHCLPILLILFYPDSDVAEDSPFVARSDFWGWASIALLLVAASVPHFEATDQKYSLQGMKFGVGMLDANRQCVSRGTVVYADGHLEKFEKNWRSGMNRCGPYRTWFRLKQRCKIEPGITRIEWRFMTSLNGNPFYQLVDVPDACALKYEAFGENSWIQTPDQGAAIAGFPRKNMNMYDEGGSPTIDFVNEPDTGTKMIFDSPSNETRSTTEIFFARNQNALIIFWWFVWSTVGSFFIFRRLRISIRR